MHTQHNDSRLRTPSVFSETRHPILPLCRGEAVSIEKLSVMSPRVLRMSCIHNLNALELVAGCPELFEKLSADDLKLIAAQGAEQCDFLLTTDRVNNDPNLKPILEQTQILLHTHYLGKTW